MNQPRGNTRIAQFELGEWGIDRAQHTGLLKLLGQVEAVETAVRRQDDLRRSLAHVSFGEGMDPNTRAIQ